MTKKIFHSIFIVALAVLFACLTLIMGVLFHYFRGVQKDQLRTELNLAAAAVEMNGTTYLETLKNQDSKLTWISSDGTVLFDSQGNAAAMENHAQREEIIEALSTGRGESIRYSTTLTEETLYYAKQLSDGSVLRTSVSYASIPLLLLELLQPVLIVFLLALILSGIFGEPNF